MGVKIRPLSDSTVGDCNIVDDEQKLHYLSALTKLINHREFQLYSSKMKHLVIDEQKKINKEITCN
jgi:hypothetical protein